MIIIAAKCQFSAWDDWTPCRDGNQQRIRKVSENKNKSTVLPFMYVSMFQVMKGAEKKSCQKKALQNNKC